MTSTYRPPPPRAITLTVSALLGLGMLAGCTAGGSGSASPAASATRSPAAPAGTGPASTGPAGTGPAGTGPAGTGPANAGPANAGPTGTSPAGLPAAGLLSDALAALTTGGSVHVDVTERSPGNLVTFSQDSTASGGRQVITFDGAGRATILLINGVGYVRADAETLQGFFQTSVQQAEQAAGQWISLRPGQTLGSSTYDDVTAGITLSSVAQELQLGQPLTRAARATVAGQPVIGVQAPLPVADDLPGAKMVLYVTDDSALRPVIFELVGGGSTTNELSFSRWGEKLTLTAPANAIPAPSISSSVIT